MDIQYKDGEVFIEEVKLNNIIDSYTTPIYLYSQKIIEETYNKLDKDLSAEIFFAIKANSNQAILTLMKNCGAGADVVSVGELKRALQAGFNPNKIIFEGVGKSKDDIIYAIKNNIRLINVESIKELNMINLIGKNLDKIIDIGVRLNPNIDSNSLDKISTGKKTDKFGISIEKLNEIISKITSSNNINLKGISCHVGSQIYDILIFKKVFIAMKEAASIILAAGIKIEHVDLGGGFAINYEQRQNELDIDGIAKLINSLFFNEPYQISFEPGRYLIARAGIIITKILTTKENGGINFLITDAGMHTLLRPAMYGSLHQIEALNKSNKDKVIYTIAGPICESSDIIAKEITLPKQNIDDYLIIHDVGAYGATMASNYNSRGIPNEILIHKNKFSIIHKEEQILEIIKRDSIPDWL